VTSSHSRDFLLDVSRLIWRAWEGHQATGIDRVCLAYLGRFASRSQLVIRRKGLTFVLSAGQSARIGRLLQGGRVSKARLAAALLPALIGARRTAPQAGMLYLNVGHTGLDDGAMASWLTANSTRPIYLVHDLIPLTHPQYCRPGEATKHARRMGNVLASADGIIVNSRDTLGAVERFAVSTGAKVPPAVVAWIAGVSIDGPVVPRPTGKPYFLTVGTIEGRKNHLLLLEMWERLVDSMGSNAPGLVIIGRRGWQAEQTFRKLDDLGPLEGHVTEIANCGDEELASWIAGARALLMPSFVEGFGLPVMEALQLGTPVIASNLPVYREIAGDLPTYLDPNDAAAWEDTIRSFLDDGSERTRQREAMKDFRPPSWDQHFETVEGWLQAL
jgi:glycosyltransferase involved in cell wall biosynthesis